LGKEVHKKRKAGGRGENKKLGRKGVNGRDKRPTKKLGRKWTEVSKKSCNVFQCFPGSRLGGGGEKRD